MEEIKKLNTSICDLSYKEGLEEIIAVCAFEIEQALIGTVRQVYQRNAKYSLKLCIHFILWKLRAVHYIPLTRHDRLAGLSEEHGTGSFYMPGIFTCYLYLNTFTGFIMHVINFYCAGLLL